MITNSTKLLSRIGKIRKLKDFMFRTASDKYNHDILVSPSYKKLETNHSNVVRDLFTKCANKLQLDPNKPLYTLEGELIANGFERMVVGDYGAYLEYDLSQVPNGVKYIIPDKQKYRLLPNYKKRIKYIWYEMPMSKSKIYWQLRGVSYADYKAKKFYVSPYEVIQLEEGEFVRPSELDSIVM